MLFYRGWFEDMLDRFVAWALFIPICLIGFVVIVYCAEEIEEEEGEIDWERAALITQPVIF